MNAFEKIIEGLEKVRDERVFVAEHTFDVFPDGQVSGLEKAIEIVNQVAEEYSSSEITNKSDGWITVSQRLPERQDSDCTFICFYLVQGYFERIYKGFRNEDGEWVSERGNIINGVVAWMPLPEPYQPKGE